MGRTISCCAAIAITYFVLTFTHELSPYMIVVQLGALAAVRMLRPRWLPLVLAAIAVGYFLPRLGFVNAQYGILRSLGDFFGNASPPSFASGAASVPRDQKLIESSAKLLSAEIWGLAAVGAWIHRRSGRSTLSLALLAVSPAVLLIALAYGNEGILRVYLFSLPWSAALAALALTTSRREAMRHRSKRRDAAAQSPVKDLTTATGHKKTVMTFVRIALALGVALALFFPAFFGDDGFNVMSRAEVTTVTSFLRTATPGPIYRLVDNGPFGIPPVIMVFH